MHNHKVQFWFDFSMHWELWLESQIREQMSVSDLHVFFGAKKKLLSNFSVRTLYYSVFKKKIKTIFDLEKVKKQASKIAHNRPRPFYFTVQPRPQPTAQNWFFILWNLGTGHLFSYLWLEFKVVLYLLKKIGLINVTLQLIT